MRFYSVLATIALLAIVSVPAFSDNASADHIYPELIFHVSDDRTVSVYVSEDMCVPEAEQRDGYIFKGWGLEDGTPLVIPGFMPDEDTDIYPIYDPISGWEPDDGGISFSTWIVIILGILTAIMAVYVLWDEYH